MGEEVVRAYGRDGKDSDAEEERSSLAQWQDRWKTDRKERSDDRVGEVGKSAPGWEESREHEHEAQVGRREGLPQIRERRGNRENGQGDSAKADLRAVSQKEGVEAGGGPNLGGRQAGRKQTKRRGTVMRGRQHMEVAEETGSAFPGWERAGRRAQMQ